jgi:hypothetical protein
VKAGVTVLSGNVNDSKGLEAMRIERRLQYMEKEIFIITASDS